VTDNKVTPAALVHVLRALATRLWHTAKRHYRRASVAGNPWVEAGIAFDRALAQHAWHARVAALKGAGPEQLPHLDAVQPAWRLHTDRAHEATIAVDRVVGAVGGGVREFDADFRPSHKRARGRFASIFAALYGGEAVPPIDVYRWNGDYYVLDGHHRVAAARALGQDFLDARVTEVSIGAYADRISDPAVPGAAEQARGGAD
jgi:hypothetical protein